MAKYTGNILTNLGKDLLARGVIGGEILTFTKVEIGKGTITGENQEEFIGLIDSFKVLPITSTAKLEGGSYRVRAAFSNSGITEDTYLREIGVFARGEDGVEILYSYCYTDTPDLIPAEGAGVLERVEDIITYISNAANVNAVIDQSKVYATIKDFAEGLASKENKFDKNDGFNREKSDSASLVSSVILATATAVKTAYDKAVSALNTANSKEPKITKKTGFNLDKTDSITSTSSILLVTAKAVKTAYDKALEVLGLTNTNKAAILNNTEQIENLSYVESGTSLNGSRTWADGRYEEWGYGSTLTIVLTTPCISTVLPHITAGRSVADTTVSFSGESPTGFTIVKSGNATYFHWRIEGRWK